jgi:rSAM/selenodomain-associated transferase 2
MLVQDCALSIVVPVLDEAQGIGSFLDSLATLRTRGAELIVADGGSIDCTPELAASRCDAVVKVARGRARQMNAGARAATCDVLLFLHADTFLPVEADTLVCRALADGSRVWGRFDVTLSGKHPLLRLVEFMMNIRSRFTGIATGDQAIFMTRLAFDAVGGFPEVALMEDIEMSRRLKRLSRPACLEQRVTTSSRRWEKNGVVRTIALMWWLRLCHALGIDSRRLERMYRRASPRARDGDAARGNTRPHSR